MNKQEKAAKEVEVTGWLKAKGYDRRTWQSISKIIVEYLNEQQVNSVDLADVVKSCCENPVPDMSNPMPMKRWCKNCHRKM